MAVSLWLRYGLAYSCVSLTLLWWYQMLNKMRYLLNKTRWHSAKQNIYGAHSFAFECVCVGGNNEVKWRLLETKSSAKPVTMPYPIGSMHTRIWSETYKYARLYRVNEVNDDIIHMGWAMCVCVSVRVCLCVCGGVIRPLYFPQIANENIKPHLVAFIEIAMPFDKSLFAFHSLNIIYWRSTRMH